MSNRDNSQQNIEDLNLNIINEKTILKPRLPCTCIKRHCYHRIAWEKLNGVVLSPIVNSSSIYAGPDIKAKSPSKRKVQFNVNNY